MSKAIPWYSWMFIGLALICGLTAILTAPGWIIAAFAAWAFWSLAGNGIDEANFEVDEDAN